MYLSSICTVLAAAAAGVSAASLPSFNTVVVRDATSNATAANVTENELSKRGCKRLDPHLVLSYFKEHPTWNAWGTAVSKKVGNGQGSITGRTAIVFKNIPNGAQGCLLHYALPKNNRQYAKGDAHTVNVYGADRAASPKVCWKNQPRKLQQYSSFNVPTAKNKAISSALLSVPCDRARKGFILETGDWQRNAGSVKLPQKPTSVGFWLSYNC